MRKILTAAAVLALSVSAFAGDYEAFDLNRAASTKTREQVNAELLAARRNGSLKVFSSTYNHAADFVATKSRAQVQEELQVAKASGEYELLNAPEVVSFLPKAGKAGSVTVTRTASAR